MHSQRKALREKYRWWRGAFKERDVVAPRASMYGRFVVFQILHSQVLPTDHRAHNTTSPVTSINAWGEANIVSCPISIPSRLLYLVRARTICMVLVTAVQVQCTMYHSRTQRGRESVFLGSNLRNTVLLISRRLVSLGTSITLEDIECT